MNSPSRLRETLLSIALQPRNLAKRLSRLIPAATPQATTVLALDGQWLKLLQVDATVTGKRITAALACPVAGLNPEDILKTLKDACATEQLAPREVLIATPSHLCTVRVFSVPSTDPKEIRDIVELQAEKHTPYAKEEIASDFMLLDRSRAGYSRVLLVIAHQDVVQRPVRLMEMAGFTLDRVGCEMEGLIHWVRLARKRAGTPAAGGASLVVEIDASTTTLIVLQHDQLQLQRSLATGVEQLHGDPTHAGERLVHELQRSVDALEAEGGPAKVQDVFVTGRVERLGELKTLIERGLDVPVILVSPWDACDVAERVQMASERLPDVSFASLVGLAIGTSVLDLTPQATRLQQAFESRAKALVLIGCQLVATLILLSLLIIGRAQKQQRYYTRLRAVYEQSAQEAFKVEEALRALEFVKARLRARGHLLDTISTLATLSPQEIHWETLTYTKGEEVIVKGSSVELPKIYEYVASLDAAPLFSHVEARRVAQRKTDQKDVNEFEISCPFAPLKQGSS